LNKCLHSRKCRNTGGNVKRRITNSFRSPFQALNIETSKTRYCPYLKASGLMRGLLINFGEATLAKGIKQTSLCPLCPLWQRKLTLPCPLASERSAHTAFGRRHRRYFNIVKGAFPICESL